MNLGSRGNKTDSRALLAFCIISSIASLFGAVYFLTWQTHVMYLDIIVSAIQIVFISIEIVLCLVSM